MNTIRYYLLPNSTALKLCNEKDMKYYTNFKMCLKNKIKPYQYDIEHSESFKFKHKKSIRALFQKFHLTSEWWFTCELVSTKKNQKTIKTFLYIISV